MLILGSYIGAIYGTIMIHDIKIVPLCNGSTADFGSVSQGSNPCGTTNMKRALQRGSCKVFSSSSSILCPGGGIGRHASFRD